MSVKAVAWAFEQHNENMIAAEKLTLIALADRADEDGNCWPGKQDLAKRTSQSARTVQRHLGKLERLGLLRVERRKRKDGTQATNRYSLPLAGRQIDTRQTPQPGDTNVSGGETPVSPHELPIELSPPTPPKIREGEWEGKDGGWNEWLYEYSRVTGNEVKGAREAARFFRSAQQHYSLAALKQAIRGCLAENRDSGGKTGRMYGLHPAAILHPERLDRWIAAGAPASVREFKDPDEARRESEARLEDEARMAGFPTVEDYIAHREGRE